MTVIKSMVENVYKDAANKKKDVQDKFLITLVGYR